MPAILVASFLSLSTSIRYNCTSDMLTEKNREGDCERDVKDQGQSILFFARLDRTHMVRIGDGVNGVQAQGSLFKWVRMLATPKN